MADYAEARLTDLPLHSLLSGPLVAAVEAEQEAARHTLDFIREIGFTGEGEKMRPRMVEFGFARTRVGPGGERREVGATLEIPLLLLVPTPSLEIDELTVDFLAKIRSVETGEGDEGQRPPVLSSRLASRYAFLRAPSRLRVRPTARKKDDTERTTASYDLSVNLVARAQEPPEGLERLLEGLAGQMRETEGSPQG